MNPRQNRCIILSEGILLDQLVSENACHVHVSVLDVISSIWNLESLVWNLEQQPGTIPDQ